MKFRFAFNRPRLVFFTLFLVLQGTFSHLASGQYADKSDAALYEELSEGINESLVEVRPVIAELLKRTEGEPEQETYLFLMGLSFQDEFSDKKQNSLLEEAVGFYEQYVEKFPGGPRRDFVRFNLAGAYADLENFEKAVEQYNWLYRRSENAALRTESRDRMAELHIRFDRASEGIPLFLEVFDAAVLNPELRAQTASWLLQGYLAAGEPEKILPYLRYLTGRYEAIYDPKFNITLLKTGDELFEKENYDQAILLYSFVKRRDAIIEFYEDLVDEIRAKLRYIAPDSERYTVTDSRLKTAEANLRAVREIRAYDVDMLWRIARVYRETERTWESLWAFYHLYQDNVDNPDQKDNIENFLYIAFEEAKEVSDDTMVEKLATEYLAVENYSRFRDQVILGLAEYYDGKQRYEELMALVDDYLEDPKSYRVAAQLLNYAGNYFVSQSAFRQLNQYATPLVDRFRNREPLYEAARYWSGLSQILLAD